MRIQATTQNFNGRVNINSLRRISASEAGTLTGKSSALGSLAGTVTSAVSGASATSTIAGGSEVIGTAFASKATGVNSSGIVPSIMGSATPHLTPASAVSTNNHPSTIGSLFSTIGAYFSNVKVKLNNVKYPS